MIERPGISGEALTRAVLAESGQGPVDSNISEQGEDVRRWAASSQPLPEGCAWPETHRLGVRDGRPRFRRGPSAVFGFSLIWILESGNNGQKVLYGSS